MGVLLAVGALAIGCVLAVLWSYISNYLEESKAKDRWKRVQEKLDDPPSSGGSKARKTKAFSKQSPKPTSKPTQPKAAAAAPAVPEVVEEDAPEEIDDVEVSDEAPETAEEEVAETPQETSPEKAKKKKKRRPAKTQEVAEDEAEVEEAQEADDAEEEEADAEEKIDAEALGLDGWTMTKVIKKKAAHADDAEATDEAKKEKEDEEKKEKVKKEKVSDLRRRKAQINKKIKDLEEVLETKHQREEENKTLESRARLSADLENINRSIQRLTGLDRGDERVAVEAPPDSPTGGADGDAWQEGYPQEGEQWEQHEWTAGTEWWGSSRGKGRGKSWDTSRGKGKGHVWEAQEVPAADEDWQEQEWWGSAATASTGAAWVEKGKGQRRGKRGGVQSRQWAAPAWWEDASWEAGAVDASASSWQVVGADAWEGGEWAEDRDGGAEDAQQNTSVKRERRGRGRGRGDKGEGKGEGNRRRQEWPEDEEAAWESTSRSPQATPHGSPAPAAKGEDHKGSRRERKGKGKGKEGKDHDSGESNQWDAKGEDSGGKGKSKKGKKGKDENGHKDDKASMEDWLRQRLGVRKPAGEVEPEPTADAIDRGEELRQAIAPLFGNKIGERPNWGDAESSDEDRNDRPAAVKRLARPAHLNAALKNTENTTASMQRAGAKARENVKHTSPPDSPQPRSCDVEGVSAAAAQSAAASKAPAKSRRPLAAAGGAKGDEDLSAFIGEDALHDDKKFEEAIKYVPTWVREKALRQRKQSRPTTES